MSGLGKTVGNLSGGFLWKAGAIGAAVLAIILGGMLLAEQFKTNDLTRQRNELTQSINDPKTGYIAQLSQSRTNVAQLRTSYEHQIVVMREEAARNARVLESTRTQLTNAQAVSRRNEQRVNELMRRPPQGNTLEERVRDIDSRIMKDLNRE